MGRKLFFNMGKGGKLMTIWWFVCLILVIAGVVLATNIFYSQGPDVRGIEAQNIGKLVLSCYGDYDGAFESFDFFSECNINQTIFENGNYFLKLSLLDSSDGESKVLNEIRFGNYALENDCLVGEKTLGRNFPKCSRSEFVVDRGKLGLSESIEILAGVNSKGGRIKN